MFRFKRIVTIILIALIIIGTLIYVSYKKSDYLPPLSYSVLNTDVLYKITMHDTDTSGLRFGEPKQFYRILLKANQSYRFVARVNWLSMEAKLYGNGKIIKELNCGYNERCNFTVKQDKDTWALLRVSANELNTPFTLEVRKISDVFDNGESAVRSESLQPLSLPVLQTDKIYNGHFIPDDAPYRIDGSGYSQSYLVELRANQKVYIQATSSRAQLGLQVSDFMDMRQRLREKGNNICLMITAPKNGMYTVVIYKYDELNPESPENNTFTLNVSNSVDEMRECQPGI